jgi:hypothetical protein
LLFIFLLFQKDMKRGVVVNVDWSLVRVYLVDEGQIVLCEAQELASWPQQLTAFPAMAVPVLNHAAARLSAVVEELEGVLLFKDSRLQLASLAATDS